MSIQHLDMLKKELYNKGWDICNPYSHDLYYVSEDFVVCWKITRGENTQLTLHFPIFGKLGERSTDLNDILYCEESLNKNRLYFDKIKSNEWRTSLKDWIICLGRNEL